MLRMFFWDTVYIGLGRHKYVTTFLLLVRYVSNVAKKSI